MLGYESLVIAILSTDQCSIYFHVLSSFFKYLIYVIFGCAGSSLPHTAFL